MPDSVVIDTNIAIYLAKNNERTRRYGALVDGKVIAISFITVAELSLNSRKAADPKAAQAYWDERLPFFAILWPDAEMCEIWAGITAGLKKGTTRQDNDLWIAASALRYSLPLVTHNAKDFEGIANLEVRTLPDPPR